MRKPDGLRAGIQAAIPSLAATPEDLKIFIDKGRIVTTAAPGLAFEYRYRLTLQLLDFAGDEDVLFLAILGWLKANNEWSLLEAYNRGDREGIGFDVDVLDNDKVDIEIGLDLSERVLATIAEGGGWTITHPEEPPLADLVGGDWAGAPLTSITANGEQILPAPDSQ